MSASIPSENKVGLEEPPLPHSQAVEPPTTDVQDLMKYEFAKLHKEFRALENNRHDFAQKEGGMRTRANYILPLLEKDREDLRSELRIATAPTNMKMAEKFTKIMGHVIQTYDALQEKMVKKIKQIEEIERHVDKITDQVVKQEGKVIARYGTSASLAHRERKLMIAEDKLYQLTCACNLQLHANKQMRDEINDLLMERAQFFRDHRSLKRHLTVTRNKMLKIVQQAIHTYDARDEAVAKLKSLREREAKESKQFGLELQEFKRSLHHYQKELNFIKLKTKQRVVYEQAKAKRIRLGRAKERELNRILRSYHRSFRKILAYSRANSIQELVELFRKLDAANFELFKYVTNSNSECEVLREGVEILKGEIFEVHNEVENRKNSQWQIQQKLQISIISAQEKLFGLQQHTQKNAGRIDEALKYLTRALEMTQSDTGAIFAFLGSKGTVNRNNMGLCIAQLDLKITELKHELQFLETYRLAGATSSHYQQAKGRQEHYHQHKGKAHQSHGGPFAPKIHMFTVDTLDEEEDNKMMETHPLFYKEMKQVVFHRMVEDHVINTSSRTVSEKASANNFRPEVTSSTRMKSKMMLQKLQESSGFLPDNQDGSKMAVGDNEKDSDEENEEEDGQ